MDANTTHPKPYGYIYLITNQVTGAYYVGQTTKGIYQRFDQHMANAKKRWTTVPLQQAIQEYGYWNFIPQHLHTCYSQEELDDMEKKYIAEYYSYVAYGGYNQIYGNKKTDIPPPPPHDPSSPIVCKKLPYINPKSKYGITGLRVRG
jgi:hypothetical protein